jgi:iron-sulfur cluster repair protein YtfE (RIC family)
MAQQDACTLLDEDHNEVMRLFEQYKASHDARHQQLLAAQICQELVVHMQIEEEIFYPEFQRATQDAYRVEDSVREHDKARAVIRQIEGDRQNAKLMLELEDEMIHHINDEREKMFPEARKAQGLDLMGLADKLEARKQELMAAA